MRHNFICQCGFERVFETDKVKIKNPGKCPRCKQKLEERDD